MAALKKKRVMALKHNNEPIADEESDSDSEDMSGIDDSDQEEDEMMDQVVQVDFEAREAEDGDFHGIRKLLQQLFLKANVNVGEIADSIITQNYVGSVLKQIADDEVDDDSSGDGDDMMEVFGVMTVVNMTEKKDVQFPGQVKAMLIDQCKKCEPEKVTQLQSRLADNGRQIGYIVSERFLNIPPQMAAPSYDSLRTDIKNAVKKNMKYKFDEFMLISKIHKTKIEQGKKKKKKGTVIEAVSYINAEEELFFQESSFSFDYSVADEHDSAVGEEDEELVPYRRVMFVSADKLDMINERIRQTYAQ